MTEPEATAIAEDGLIADSVGRWALQKYELLSHAANIWATATKHKWTHRVYLDLFAGSGKAVIREAEDEVDNCAMRAAKTRDPFSAFVLCEQDPQKAEALGSRMRTAVPEDAQLAIFTGDANEMTEEVIKALPRYSQVEKRQIFCLLDPYNMRNLPFTTIETLAPLYIDFVVLVPVGMDAQRNFERYLQRDSETPLDRFLGRTDWRARWHEAERAGRSRGYFVMEQFAENMQNLGFKCHDAIDTVPFKNSRQSVMYRFAHFSRGSLGQKLWSEARKASNPQGNLFGG